MYVEVAHKLKIPLVDKDAHIFAYISEEGARLVSAVHLVKTLTDLEFDKARRFCTHGTVRQEFYRVEVNGVEIDLLSLENMDRARYVLNVLLDDGKQVESAIDSLVATRHLIVADKDEEDELF